MSYLFLPMYSYLFCFIFIKVLQSFEAPGEKKQGATPPLFPAAQPGGQFQRPAPKSNAWLTPQHAAFLFFYKMQLPRSFLHPGGNIDTIDPPAPAL